MSSKWSSNEGKTGKKNWKARLSLRFIRGHAIKTYKGVVVQLHTFLTSAVDINAWSALYVPTVFLPVPIGKETGWATESVLTGRQREKSVPPAGNRTPVVHPMASDYTNGATTKGKAKWEHQERSCSTSLITTIAVLYQVPVQFTSHYHNLQVFL
jgi:hypothetical protein